MNKLVKVEREKEVFFPPMENIRLQYLKKKIFVSTQLYCLRFLAAAMSSERALLINSYQCLSNSEILKSTFQK